MLKELFSKELPYTASVLCNVFVRWINGVDFQCHKSESSTAFKSNAGTYKKKKSLMVE